VQQKMIQLLGTTISQAHPRNLNFCCSELLELLPRVPEPCQASIICVAAYSGMCTGQEKILDQMKKLQVLRQLWGIMMLAEDAEDTEDPALAFNTSFCSCNSS
jgi:hypothetical protein